MIHSRRSFLKFSLLAAPAIVCAANIMPVRALVLPEEIDTQEIIAILGRRLDVNEYFPVSRYIRIGPYDVIDWREGF